MTIPEADGLLGQDAIILHGSDLSQKDALAAARIGYGGRPMCVVEDWVILDVALTEAEQARVHEAGCKPMFLFAHKVVYDERRRFQPGNWVRSSMGTSFDDGYVFVTRNTVYVLLGPGYRNTSSIQAIFSIY